MQTMSDEWAYQSTRTLAAMIRERKVSAAELTEYFIERIESHDRAINAVVVEDFERARNAALDADLALSRGELVGALHGVPFTVKESYDVAGLSTTWGIPEARHHVVADDAVLVARARAAGAVLLGKTNVPANVGDFQTYNEIYGQTNNPWDLARTPGGSSGGAAAAVAAGFNGFEIGSDMGGSLRSPAHFCGVYAHKPTWGVLPLRSQNAPGALSVPQEMDMACGGPIARTANDLALLLDVLAGPDEIVRDGWQLQLPAPEREGVEGLRVALWPDYAEAPVDREISARVTAVGEALARAGAEVSETARPEFDPQRAWQVYRSLVMAVSNMPGSEVDYAGWLELHRVRGAFRQIWQQFFQSWDVLVCPIHTSLAFPHDHSSPMSRTLTINGESRGYWEHVFWAGLATMAYLPATVFPTGLSRAGLPIGLQAIGGAFQDRSTIAFADHIGSLLGGFTPPAR